MTDTRYRPLDVSYPTNFPDSNNIPIPSGLLKDIRLGSFYILESGIKNSKQGWTWTGSRSTLSAPSGSLEPAKNLNQFSGYRNPTTTTELYDYSTVGLQISGQIRNNSELEPVVLAIPFNFSLQETKVIRISITGQIFNRFSTNAGMGFSVGWICWDSEGNRLSRLPYDWATGLDQTQEPQNVIFNKNPDLPTGTDVKYYTPSDNLSDPLRMFELEIPYDGTASPTGPGFILIAAVSYPGSDEVPDGSNLVRGADWDWVRVGGVIDPNSLDLIKTGFRYRDMFSFNSASTEPNTGAKLPTLEGKPVNYMLKVEANIGAVAQTRTPFSYHSLLHVRPADEPGKYTASQGRAMIYPYLDDSFIRQQPPIDQESGWGLTIFPLATAILTSIYIEERVIVDVDGVPENLLTSLIDSYTDSTTDSGSKALGSTLQRIIKAVDNIQQSYKDASNCYNRVKGPNTKGKLASFEVLEKNEVFPWLYYDDEVTYGLIIPGISFPLNYSSVSLEGWNDGEARLFVESCTPKVDTVNSTEPNFFLDNLLDGDDQALGLDVNYPLSVGMQGEGGYNVNNDYTIAYMPFNGAQASLTGGEGIPSEQFDKGSSFNTPGMLDRYYNDNIDPRYRVLSTLYPLLDDAGSTDFERASGFTNNYSTCGGIALNTIESIWKEDPTESLVVVGDGYAVDGISSRGNLDIVGPTSDGLISIDKAMVFVIYGSIYTSLLTPDPS